MVQLLGFQITRQTDDKEKPAEAKQAFTVPSPDDGTTTISAGGYFGQYLDMEVTAKNDVDLIKRYREIAQHPECDMAIEDIINEVIVSDERDQSVTISLDKLAVSESIKGKIGFDILNDTGLSTMFFYERFQTENSHSDTLYFLTGYVTHRNEEFVVELENETARINFNQDINGFDVKLSSNYNLLSEIDDYGATIEVAKKF